MAVTAAAATAAAVAPVAMVAPAKAVGPTSAQLQKAVRAAERSKDLWATINVCHTRQHPHELGIRGQMPSLGFLSQMYMTFEVSYRPAPLKAFTPMPSTKDTVFVGRTSDKLLQGGVSYHHFKPPLVLEGSVTFQWWHKGKLVGSVTHTTTRGHHADFAQPPGYSAAFCTI